MQRGDIIVVAFGNAGYQWAAVTQPGKGRRWNASDKRWGPEVKLQQSGGTPKSPKPMVLANQLDKLDQKDAEKKAAIKARRELAATFRPMELVRHDRWGLGEVMDPPHDRGKWVRVLFQDNHYPHSISPHNLEKVNS